MERRDRLPRLKAHESWSAGRQHEPVDRRTTRIGRNIDTTGPESFLWSNSGILVAWRCHDRATTASPAVSTLHHGRVLPEQRGTFDLPFVSITFGAAVL